MNPSPCLVPRSVCGIRSKLRGVDSVLDACGRCSVRCASERGDPACRRPSGRRECVRADPSVVRPDVTDPLQILTGVQQPPHSRDARHNALCHQPVKATSVPEKGGGCLPRERTPFLDVLVGVVY